MEEPAPPSPTRSPRPVVLKHNLNRSVLLEAAGEDVVVVKRYHGAGRLHRMLDGRRARRERRSLELALAAGLPVPRVLDLRRREGHWELVTEHLRDAVSLRAVLDGDAPWPCCPARMMASLAHLHARAVEAGLSHDDLHAGNVLVDAEGRAWLVDLARARLGTRLGATEVRAQLLRLTADVRECLSPRLRMRFLVCLRRALPGPLVEGLGDLRELAGELERGARTRRRRDLELGAARWTRTSSVTRALRERLADGRELSCVVRRAVPLEGLRSWLRRLPSARPAAPRAELQEVEGWEGTLLTRLDPDLHGLREAWSASARLVMHGVPAALPAALVLQPTHAALFELEQRSRPLAEGPDRRDWRRRAARAVGRVLGTLHERGLALRDLRTDQLWLSVDGRRAWFGPGPPLVPLYPGQAEQNRAELLDWCRGPVERALFERAYEREAGGASEGGRPA